jgi:hypothetical protein
LFPTLVARGSPILIPPYTNYVIYNTVAKEPLEPRWLFPVPSIYQASGVASPTIWSRNANFNSSLFISLEIDCVDSSLTWQYLHSGTESLAGALYSSSFNYSIIEHKDG